MKDEKLPEIDSVRVYQSILFEKKQETHFSTRLNPNTKKVGRVVSINNELRGIEIKSALDHVFVPFTNVSCIYFRSEIKKQQIEEGKSVMAKKVGMNPVELKKPKKIGRD